MRSLVIGAGQVGSALYQVIKPYHESKIRDLEDLKMSDVDVLHICYPDHEGFEKTTKDYIEQYKPRLTIINSSVAVGTTRRCGANVVYSPVRGRHPKLVDEMLKFPKFVAGKDFVMVRLAAEYFEKCGWKVHTSNSPETLELLKLLSNIHMGLEVAWRQEVGRILNHFEASEDDYEIWEDTYNQGYKEVGHDHLLRPRMRPDPIGGHCILECTNILRKQFESSALDFIVRSNDRAWNEMEPAGVASL